MHRDQLRVPSPCHADWSAMSGDDRRRHCASCDKSVHDLSAMSEREAARLLSSGGGLCVRYAARPDGTVVHRASPARLPRIVAVAGALLAAAPALASSAPAHPTPPDAPAEPSLVERLKQRLLEALGAEQVVSQGQVEVVMGEPAEPPPPPPPRPEVVMGKLAAPPVTIELPPPAPPAVIPEAEEPAP